jgi:small subunit ribosomal protein S3
MGQKVNPIGARVGVNRDWSTRWYAGKKAFAGYLLEDYKLREMLKKKYAPVEGSAPKGGDRRRPMDAGLSRIDIERAANKLTVNIFTAKPGIVIGRGGAGVEALKKEIEAFTGRSVVLNIMEIRQPETDAQLVAASIAQQLQNRVSFRRAMKQAMGRTMKAGAKGIKLQVSGRLGGAEIARTEGYHEGSIPLQTLRANIDYGFAEAHTTYGRIGVKVWIYKGQTLPKAKRRPIAEGGK